MKTIGIIFVIWVTLNITALLINLLFSNLITGTLTMILTFATAIWLITKTIKEL